MISELRARFNKRFTESAYGVLLRRLEERCSVPVEFRVAETPIFVAEAMLGDLAGEGAGLARQIIANSKCLDAARRAIPVGYRVAGESAHPNFLTADFALARDAGGDLVPRLVEIQAFPSVYGYQVELCSAYREAYGLDPSLKVFLSGLNEESYWQLLARTILAGHDPENVVLTELDPIHQKTLPDFNVTARKLGIAVVDIRALEPVGNRLHYRNSQGRLVPIHRIYNRAIADELIAKQIQLPFDLEHEWDVEWAGHPNWYFLISKFSIPWLSSSTVPPAVFLSDFLENDGKAKLAAAGVLLPQESGPDTIYSQLLLKPLFSFAGKGIEFEPSRRLLESIEPSKRPEFLLQQRMRFEPTIETPFGLTQAEIRILYAWPDGGKLTPALSLVRLGRGKMMGVDHNRNLRWVGASAAFSPSGQ
ncbi:MAG TPA: hypothetical protein VL986_13275 [Terracidiphilus sp.]|nr:hypothetical protein [Terracidiphilus sp.]